MNARIKYLNDNVYMV